MSEIKTACRGTSRLIEVATMTHEEYLNLHTQGAKELRAVYEAKCNEVAQLQKENAELKRNITNALKERKHQEDSNIKLREENAAQAKRITELEELLNYYKNMVGA